MPILRLLKGDCLALMPTLASRSVDAVVTDPPYGINFMGKVWDGPEGIAFQADFWAEVLRVLKPGGHLLAFGGTRMHHRLTVAIEDAGFEIRDMVAWLYGVGFSKSFNLRRAPMCDCAGGGKAVPCSHDEAPALPECDLRQVRDADVPAPIDVEGKRGEVLLSGLSECGAPEFRDARPEPQPCGGEQSGLAGRQLHRAREGLSDDPQPGAPEGTRERVRAGAHLGRGADAGPAAEVGRGSASHQPGSVGQPTGEPEGVCRPSDALDGGALHGRGACPRCGKLKQEFEGFGTGLKPALEPVTLARKPLQGTIAQSVLAHGTGALNIDGCRITAADGDEVVTFERHAGDRSREQYRTGTVANARPSNLGRWPANLIHDGSEEVEAAFAAFGTSKDGVAVQRNGGGQKFGSRGIYGGSAGMTREDVGFGGSGTASRFFYSAKASKADRGEGNTHPTVKPTELMRYLCRLITPPGGTVLDPFMGSGSTGKAAALEGFSFIGIERDEGYFAIAEKRIADAQMPLLMAAE
ncbi:hypothetical protein J2X36_002132 [Methylobacterium sp. BE186]|nr:DNA methyltransferase [Methylobacterium sp. BE186]MDR7037385.1 hypothetical protein [Methylobacterium sp. BE186]